VIAATLGLMASAAQAMPVSSSVIRDAVAAIDPVEQAAVYVVEGRRYCFYFNGWHGAGWYRCGFAWRRGLGWGGVYGWQGWTYGPAARRFGGDVTIQNRTREGFRTREDFRTREGARSGGTVGGTMQQDGTSVRGGATTSGSARGGATFEDGGSGNAGSRSGGSMRGNTEMRSGTGGDGQGPGGGQRGGGGMSGR